MSKWISIHEKLPEENQELLMTYNDLVMEGFFCNKKFYYPSTCAHVLGYCDCEDQQGITHWMPLPEPPKKEHACQEEKLPDHLCKRYVANGSLWKCVCIKKGRFCVFDQMDQPVMYQDFCIFCGEKA